MKTKVFYAWQSDHDPAICRTFILKAAEVAVKKLNGEIEEAFDFELDHDTKGKGGCPPVADTIREKISEATIFLADVTHIKEHTTFDGRKKKLQNGNVLIEFGIAMQELSWRRIVWVMNEAYGKEKDLPFDLATLRRPLRYDVKDRNDPKLIEKRDALAEDIAKAINDITEEMRESGTYYDPSVKLELHVGNIWGTGNKGHVRWLEVKVINQGVSLNNVRAELHVWRPEKKIAYMFSARGDVPDPLARAFSCAFDLANTEPHEDLPELRGVSPENVAIVIMSGVREVKRLSATEWKKELDAHAKGDKNLPAKPPPREPKHHGASISAEDWMNRPKRW